MGSDVNASMLRDHNDLFDWIESVGVDDRLDAYTKRYVDDAGGLLAKFIKTYEFSRGCFADQLIFLVRKLAALGPEALDTFACRFVGGKVFNDVCAGLHGNYRFEFLEILNLNIHNHVSKAGGTFQPSYIHAMIVSPCLAELEGLEINRMIHMVERIIDGSDETRQAYLTSLFFNSPVFANAIEKQPSTVARFMMMRVFPPLSPEAADFLRSGVNFRYMHPAYRDARRAQILSYGEEVGHFVREHPSVRKILESFTRHQKLGRDYTEFAANALGYAQPDDVFLLASEFVNFEGFARLASHMRTRPELLSVVFGHAHDDGVDYLSGFLKFAAAAVMAAGVETKQWGMAQNVVTDDLLRSAVFEILQSRDPEAAFSLQLSMAFMTAERGEAMQQNYIWGISDGIIANNRDQAGTLARFVSAMVTKLPLDHLSGFLNSEGVIGIAQTNPQAIASFYFPFAKEKDTVAEFAERLRMIKDSRMFEALEISGASIAKAIDKTSLAFRHS